MLRFIKICCIAISLSMSLGTSLGCSKKAEVTSVSMQMPDWNALTNKSGALAVVKVVDRVMINITGPDIATPIVYIWQMDRDSVTNGSFPSPPAEFELTVPRGSDRLIQVLTLIQDYDTATQGKDGNMVFYYGDTIKSLANAVESVNITLAVASNSSQGEGSISGRYFNADGSTPTGMVNMYFALPGKNPMIVERTSIFSGYFHFFLLPDVPFTYRLDSGASLFESVTTATFNGLGSRAMHMAVPQGYREYSGGGTRSYVSPRRKIVGFFGPGSTLLAREMCYVDSVTAISGFLDAATAGSPIYWNPSSANSTDARVISGGSSDSAGICNSGGDFGTNVLNFNPNRLIYGDSPLPIRGPFTEFIENGYSTFLNVTQTGTNQLLVDWAYLPGVVGNSVDGVGLFYRIFGTSESLEDNWHDSAPCNKLSQYGYTEVTRIAAGTSGQPISAYTWNTSTEVITGRNSGRLKTVICPYTNAKPGYYDFAIRHYNSSGYTPIATQILASSLTEASAISSAANPQKIARETCTAVKVRMADSSGTPASRMGSTGDMTVGVSTNGAATQLYQNSTCTVPGGGLSSMTYSLNQNFETLVFVREDASQTTDYQLTISDVTSGGTALPTITHYIQPMTPTNATHIRAVAATDIVRWQCYAYTVSSGTLDGSSLIAQLPSAALSISLPYTGGPDWYSDSSCLTPTTPSTSISIDSSMTKLYFRYTAGPNSIGLAPLSNSGGLTIAGPTASVTDPPSASRLRLEGIGSTHNGVCSPIRLVAYNQSGQVAPPTAAQTVAISYSSSATTGEGIFGDPSCTPGNEVGSMSLTVGQPISSTLYFRWGTNGPLSVVGTGSSLTFDTINTQVQP